MTDDRRDRHDGGRPRPVPTRRHRHHAASGGATPTGGEFTDYVMPAVEGEVVLDVIHRIQATEAPDLACRWNCKAGKCGSCSAEINGQPAPHVHDPHGHAARRASRSRWRR